MRPIEDPLPKFQPKDEIFHTHNYKSKNPKFNNNQTLDTQVVTPTELKSILKIKRKQELQ